LARREYGSRELHQKLLHKGCAEPVAAQTVERLKTQQLLSDERFVESLIAARRRRGYGPVRIAHELREKGIAPEAIEDSLGKDDAGWLEEARRVHRKKFGAARPKSYAERAKRARFLQYRGFTPDQIRRILDSREAD